MLLSELHNFDLQARCGSLDLWFNPKQYQQAQGQRYILFDSPLSLRDVAITATFFFVVEMVFCTCATQGIEHSSRAPHSHASTTMMP